MTENLVGRISAKDFKERLKASARGEPSPNPEIKTWISDEVEVRCGVCGSETRYEERPVEIEYKEIKKTFNQPCYWCLAECSPGEGVLIGDDAFVSERVMKQLRKDVDAAEKAEEDKIRAAIADDPDAAPILDEEWFKKARLVKPTKTQE